MTIHDNFGKRFQPGRAYLLGVALAFLLVSAPIASGQAPDFPAILQATAAGNQVVIRAVRDLNPQTPVELATAMNTMLDLGEPVFARYYLSRLQALQLDDPARFEIYEALGSAFFLRLHGDDSMQPEGRVFAREILAAGYAQATSPERVQALIDRLRDPDPSARATAIRTLRNLGPVATAEILHRLLFSPEPTELPNFRQALRSMGDDAVGPLLAGSRASHPQVQTESIIALASYQSPEVNQALLRAFFSPKSSDSMKQFAFQSLSRRGSEPTDSRIVEDRFYEMAMDYLMGRQTLRQGLLGEATLWQWDTASNRLVSSTVPTSTAVRITASQLAADLYELQPASPRNRALYLLTHLESAKRIAGPSRRVDLSSVSEVLGKIDLVELERVLADALKLDLIPAATACCQLLGEMGSSDLVVSATSRPRPLVEAILSGDRYLQFAVLEAIHKLDPQQAFVGSSYIFSMAVFMASSQGREAALVGDHRLEIAQSYAAHLSLERLTGLPATQGQELFALATQNPDVELIVISDNLQRPAYLELLPQLRSDMRTKRLPIAVLIRDAETSVRLQTLTARDTFLISMPMSLEPGQIVSQVRRLKALNRPWTVELLDRQHHAQVAANWLHKIASDRQRYRFYDLGSREQELMKIIYLPGLAEQGSALLQSLGTANAQRELLNFVGQSGFPLESRQAAAQAFAETIKRGGTMLTREEVLQQYHRYNASAVESAEAQQLLGSILDALELRIRDKSQ
jgi:CheY-like chemotaxis protein